MELTNGKPCKITVIIKNICIKFETKKYQGKTVKTLKLIIYLYLEFLSFMFLNQSI